jgi:hypothetical protein
LYHAKLSDLTGIPKRGYPEDIMVYDIIVGVRPGRKHLGRIELPGQYNGGRILTAIVDHQFSRKYRQGRTVIPVALQAGASQQEEQECKCKHVSGHSDKVVGFGKSMS